MMDNAEAILRNSIFRTPPRVGALPTRQEKRRAELVVLGEPVLRNPCLCAIVTSLWLPERLSLMNEIETPRDYCRLPSTKFNS
jgi:hypothetical protein